jgi:hypothetical protein
MQGLDDDGLAIALSLGPVGDAEPTPPVFAEDAIAAPRPLDHVVRC